MVRSLVITVLVAGLFVFFASLGIGMGLSAGGGEVRILSSWSETHSESGQAVAVYGSESEPARVVVDTPARPHTRGLDTADQLIQQILIASLIVILPIIGYMARACWHYGDDGDEAKAGYVLRSSIDELKAQEQAKM